PTAAVVNGFEGVGFKSSLMEARPKQMPITMRAIAIAMNRSFFKWTPGCCALRVARCEAHPRNSQPATRNGSLTSPRPCENFHVRRLQALILHHARQPYGETYHRRH